MFFNSLSNPSCIFDCIIHCLLQNLSSVNFVVIVYANYHHFSVQRVLTLVSFVSSLSPRVISIETSMSDPANIGTRLFATDRITGERLQLESDQLIVATDPVTARKLLMEGQSPYHQVPLIRISTYIHTHAHTHSSSLPDSTLFFTNPYESVNARPLLPLHSLISTYSLVCHLTFSVYLIMNNQELPVKRGRLELQMLRSQTPGGMSACAVHYFTLYSVSKLVSAVRSSSTAASLKLELIPMAVLLCSPNLISSSANQLLIYRREALYVSILAWMVLLPSHSLVSS